MSRVVAMCGNILVFVLVGLISLVFSLAAGAEWKGVFPSQSWVEMDPADVALDSTKLDEIAAYLGGRGCIVRHGSLVYSWGNISQRGDVASAVKPWYSHFLFQAVEQGRLASLDTKVVDFEPRLGQINAGLGFKDSDITFRQMANQTSCYGVEENPGEAFDYNDWQMALFADTLFLEIYGQTWGTMDAQVLRPELTDVLDCQDNPTFLAFGINDRAGRMAISPRDFARFGLLYLNYGNWNGTQLISGDYARMAVSSPLPNGIPRTNAVAAEMISGQRSIGSTNIPDDQFDHLGSYSFLWWTNGADRNGNRFWPDAPLDAYAALGHQNGRRGLAVIPSLDVVLSYNDTTLDQRPSQPHPLNPALELLVEAATDEPLSGQIIVDPTTSAWLAYNRDEDGDGSSDPFFMCGPGDPEGFLYRGTSNPDGTRNGDQMAIIDKIKGSGANCLYMQIVRSHGGDGESSHNPFTGNDPIQGLNEHVLQQWETWFLAMDDAGIVIFLIFYDDSARIWNTGNLVRAEEQSFLETIVQRFSHHKHLIWCVAEEYQEAYSVNRVKATAAVIRAADEHNHPIAVHKLSGLDFDEFADDPNIDQFAIQYNVTDPQQFHDGMVSAWNSAAGQYNLNMSEAADYGFGSAARQKHWACAMGGAYVMALGWNFDSVTEPSTVDLEACGDLVRFFESTNFNEMQPSDDLKLGSTEYVLAKPGESYIAYSSSAGSPIGIRNLPRGTYSLDWLNVENGVQIDEEDVQVPGGDSTWDSPFGPGGEVAVWVQFVSPVVNIPTNRSLIGVR